MQLSKWHNTDKIDKILNLNYDQIQSYSTVKEIFIFNQFNLTPQNKLNNILGAFLKPSKINVRKINSKFNDNKRLLRYLRDNIELGWNFMEFDFICDFEVVIDLLIGVNYPYFLTLKSFLVVNQDGYVVDRTNEANK